MSDLVKQVSEQEFDQEVVNADVPVLVDFWAEWCAPCRALAPTLDAVAQDFSGRAKIVKVNVDEARDVAARHNITSIPTLVLYVNGKPEQTLIGLKQKGELEDLLSQHAASGA